MIRLRLSIRCILTLFFILSATNYSCLRGRDGETKELIIGDEQTILDAASEAIQNRFPDADISNLAGGDKGFTFYIEPFPDRTTFKFTLTKASGITQDGKVVTGYSYSIRSYGPQFFAEQRTVEPLKAEFERNLSKRRIALTSTRSITFEK